LVFLSSFFDFSEFCVRTPGGKKTPVYRGFRRCLAAEKPTTVTAGRLEAQLDTGHQTSVAHAISAFSKAKSKGTERENTAMGETFFGSSRKCVFDFDLTLCRQDGNQAEVKQQRGPTDGKTIPRLDDQRIKSYFDSPFPISPHPWDDFASV
jgi:hypothetical protein